MLLMHGPSERDSYIWLENTTAAPEDYYNCSAILLGDTEALQEAKLLTITNDFKRSVQIPDEYYISATQDCMYGSVNQKYTVYISISAARY